MSEVTPPQVRQEAPAFGERVSNVIINGTVATLATVAIISSDVPQIAVEELFEQEEQDVVEANAELMSFSAESLEAEALVFGSVQATVIIGGFAAAYGLTAVIRSAAERWRLWRDA